MEFLAKDEGIIIPESNIHDFIKSYVKNNFNAYEIPLSYDLHYQDYQYILNKCNTFLKKYNNNTFICDNDINTKLFIRKTFIEDNVEHIISEIFTICKTPLDIRPGMPIMLPPMPIMLPSMPIMLPPMPIMLPSMPIMLPSIPIMLPSMPTAPTMPSGGNPFQLD
jgi:hypothetical protein